MAAPTWLNSGARNSQSAATSVVPALPASRVNGNILIAHVGTDTNATHSISGSGWQALGSSGSPASTWRSSLWWRVVDGTETAPTISWTGSVANFGQIYQFTRENFDKTAPFGTVQSPSTGSTSTHTSTGFNTTRNNSLAIYIDGADVNTAMAQPTGWTERVDNGSATGSSRNVMGTKAVANSGTGTGNISVTGAAAYWVQWQLELLEPKIGATMAATESGSDSSSMSGQVKVSGTLAATSTGTDTFAATGTVTNPSSTGTMAAQETGSDTFAGTGRVLVSGALSATSTGTDAFAGTGRVAIAGSLVATETGSDVFAGAGRVAVSGALAAQEVGNDTFTGTGRVAISGSLASTETGSDVFAGTGAVRITGALAAQEAGEDDFTGAGQVAISGSLVAQEAGEDVFAGAGTVAGAGGPVAGSMEAVETGDDTFVGAGIVEPLPAEERQSRGGIKLTLPPGTKRKKPKSINSQLEEAVRRALGRFPGKRSKPPITSERLQEAAEAILNMPDIPEWEFRRVATILRDILGNVGSMADEQEMVETLLELAEDASIDEDDEELAELLIASEIEYIMSL